MLPLIIEHRLGWLQRCSVHDRERTAGAVELLTWDKGWPSESPCRHGQHNRLKKTVMSTVFKVRVSCSGQRTSVFS